MGILNLQQKCCKKNSKFEEEENIMARNRNRIVVPEARQALNQLKLEIASELGLSNYEGIDKGELTSRQNGYVGGYMVKSMIEYAEKNMSK